MVAAQQNITFTFFVILLTVISKLDDINAECCLKERVHTTLSETDGGSYRICYDGMLMKNDNYFCGKGGCNIFGCNCDGGCRTSPIVKNRADAINLFKNRRKLTSLTEMMRKKFEDPHFNMSSDVDSLTALHVDIYDLVTTLLGKLNSSHGTDISLRLENFNYDLQKFLDTLQKRDEFFSNDEETRNIYFEYLNLIHQFENLLSD